MRRASGTRVMYRYFQNRGACKLWTSFAWDLWFITSCLSGWKVVVCIVTELPVV